MPGAQAPAATGPRRSVATWASPCNGGWASSKARRHGVRCSSGTRAAGLTARCPPLHPASWHRPHPLRRPLCALAHRPAACRLAGGGAGQLARRAGAWRALAGAHRRRRHAALRAGAADTILAQLAACGLVPDEAPVWQAARGAIVPGRARCIAARGPGLPLRLAAARTSTTFWAARGRPVDRHAEAGVSRHLSRWAERQARARLAAALRHRGRALRIDWNDRRLGAQQQNLTHDGRRLRAEARRRPVGLPARGGGGRRGASGSPTWCAAKTWPTTRRARFTCSGCWACRTPIYLHTPLVRAADGAEAVEAERCAALAPGERVARICTTRGTALGLDANGATVAMLLDEALVAWRQRWVIAVDSAIVARADQPSRHHQETHHEDHQGTGDLPGPVRGRHRAVQLLDRSRSGPPAWATRACRCRAGTAACST